ncbi:MAG: hypothetical protein ACLSX5_04705 [Lachnospiraceae bacterium]
MADLEKIMLLVQRRYGILKEMDRLTRELKDTIDRKDEVSTHLLLQMRAEEMSKMDQCQMEIWTAVGHEKEDGEFLRELLTCDPFAPRSADSFEEKKILEIRQISKKTLDGLRELDQRLNLGVGGEKSFYTQRSGKK